MEGLLKVRYLDLFYAFHSNIEKVCLLNTGGRYPEEREWLEISERKENLWSKISEERGIQDMGLREGGKVPPDKKKKRSIYADQFARLVSKC